MPSPSPSPKEQATQATQGSKGNPKPLAVTIVESPEQAKAGESREAESNNHDARDLDAQIRAADAAEKQIVPSWLGAILGFLGTLLIVWSLCVARDANRIAKLALDLEHRPAIVTSAYSTEEMENGKIWFKATFRNASKATIRVISAHTIKEPEPTFPATEQQFDNLGFLTPDETVEIHLGSFNIGDMGRTLTVAIAYQAVNSPQKYRTDTTASITIPGFKTGQGETATVLKWADLAITKIA